MRPRSHPALTLLLLTGLNFLNYIDRSVLPAVQPLIQKELHRSDADMGLLTSVFFFFYMCTAPLDRKSTRLNSSHQIISYAVFCLKKKKKNSNIFMHSTQD